MICVLQQLRVAYDEITQQLYISSFGIRKDIPRTKQAFRRICETSTARMHVFELVTFGTVLATLGMFVIKSIRS